ncbi:MAG: arginine--tRNA ligase [Bacteroidota bacterium]|nr:arginine--tRNA ligase [Bacteroidota bacterium]
MLEQAIKNLTVKALFDLYQAEIDIQQVKIEATNPDFKGDFTILTFPFLRFSKKTPEETANELGHYIQTHLQDCDSYNVVKGFLNIEISKQYWLNLFSNFSEETKPVVSEKVMVEYSSPNTNKPLHLGHIRNNLLGYSVAEILKASGKDVLKINLVNDRGIHICKSMLAWQKFGNGETPQSSGMKGDHLVGKYYVEFDKQYKSEIHALVNQGLEKEQAEKQAPLMLQAQEMLRKWESGDEEIVNLWKTMNAWVYEGFNQTYQALGVDFDHYYYESNTYLLGKDIVEEGLQKNVFYKREDGSVWIDLTSDGLDEKLVLRSDGTSVYMTQDIGTAILKYQDYQCAKSLYVVGNEQDYHFKVLFLILKKMGFEWANGCFHLSYGMVDLPSGKMKSREGTVVDADDLIQEMIATAQAKTQELGKTDGMSEDEKQLLYQTLGLGALKFYMLKVDPQKRMLFNPEESIDFQGDTGPFVQYVFARINSMLKVADSKELVAKSNVSNITQSEINLIKTLFDFNDQVNKSAANYSPAIMAHYALELAKAFNRVYNEVSFLREKDTDLRIFRMQLAQKTAQTIQTTLAMLGIQCPDRM